MNLTDIIATSGNPTIDGDKGDIVVSSAGSVWTIDTAAFPNAFVQIVEATPYTSRTQISTVCPADDTIPQLTEVSTICSVTITPKSATNRLVLIGHLWGTPSTSLTPTLAIHQDSTANALQAVASYTTGSMVQMTVLHEMAAGTTSATTFKMGLGVSTGNLEVNGNGAARLYGGISAARFRVMEVRA